MNWTQDQKRIIEARNCNLLVSAAAGSGKTAVLVERIIQMVTDAENPIDIDQLLVVTFTKAAAAQMKEKIAKAIEKMLETEPENEHYLKQMNYVNHANILTIDSFCYQVVKDHFYRLSLDPGIHIGDTGEIGLLREEILEKVIEEFYEKRKDFVDFSDAFSADKNDKKIEEYILKIYNVCSSYPRPQEWTLQARAALCVENEEEFTKLLFVKRYFDEVHSTAEGIKLKVLAALEQARGLDGPIYMEKALLEDIVLVDSIISARTYSQFSDLSKVKFANIGRGKSGTFDADIADSIKKVREDYKKQIKEILANFELPFETVHLQMEKQQPMLVALLDAVDAFREAFLKAKLEKNILEFSDVEHFALQVLCEGYDEDGNPVPSDVGKEMSENFAEILIDEYQDSNYLQEAILNCVSTVYQGKNNIFMVGDVKQSIYSFRMARPDLFMDKYHTYAVEEAASCRKLLLKNNFRSRANVLEGINYIFYQIMGKDLGGIDYTEDEALVPGRTFLEVADDSIELLLGESKDFDFLSASDEEMTAEKEENLDEELEDIGKMELEATIVARRIHELMGRGRQEAFQVMDEETGQLRDVTFRDMVILFRAPSSFQQIFFETLMGQGIPVKVQNENGYFDTVEIRLILSLLRIVDNPYNDVETAAVLRSYFGGFTSDELAVLALIKKELERSEKKKIPFFKVVELTAGWCHPDTTSPEMENFLEELLSKDKERISNRIASKCQSVCELVKELQYRKTYDTIAELLSYIYRQTRYYYYVEAMPDGTQRIQNLDLFLNEAERFEKASFQSVFDFLLYIDKLQKKSISLGGDPSAESNENVVRIMSIHKSKGLEFPVVFLSGTGKNFNRQDTKTPFIIHSDYYIGAKYIDVQRRSGNDTFARKAIASLMVTESIAEELRIFYVGLTRAKEKLILTGVTTDVPALIRKYEEVAGRKDVKLSYSVVHTAKNYLDFLVAALMRNDAFHKAMQEVRKRMDKKGEQVISAEYEKAVTIQEPEIFLKVQVYDFRNIVIQHIRSGIEKQMDKRQLLEEWYQAEGKNAKQIAKNLNWEYQEEQLTRQKSKLSVTEIKRIYETDYEPSDVIHQEVTRKEDYVPPLPYFLAGEQPMDAAMKGTWMHKTMELFDFATVITKEGVAEALETMWKEGRIPEETKSFITVEKIAILVDSELGKRMHEAAKNGRLYKEKQFVVGVPVEKILGEPEDSKNGQPVVVQGIVDAYFKEEEHLVLIDYKTDYIKTGQENMLAERYKTQMLYYKDTLEQLTGLKVEESYLYSFALGKAIQVF